MLPCCLVRPKKEGGESGSCEVTKQYPVKKSDNKFRIHIVIFFFPLPKENGEVPLSEHRNQGGDLLTSCRIFLK